jgi:hypothetical protein
MLRQPRSISTVNAVRSALASGLEVSHALATSADWIYPEDRLWSDVFDRFDSLEDTLALAAVEEALGVDLGDVTFTDATTVEDLIHLCESRSFAPTGGASVPH